MMNISVAFSQNVVVYCVPLMNMGCAEPATNETDIHATVTAAVIAAMRRDGMLLAFAVLLSRHFTSLTMANAIAARAVTMSRMARMITASVRSGDLNCGSSSDGMSYHIM